MDLYQAINEIFFKVTDNMIVNIHSGTRELFGNGFFQSTILIFAMFWLVLKIAKSEKFSPQDIYPIAVWILWFYAIYFLVSNEKMYLEVLDLFQMPRDALSYVIMRIVGEGNHPNDILKALYTAINATQTILDQADGGWFSFNFIAKTMSILFFLISLLLVIVLSFILILSTLIARIVLSFGAFMFLCLIWSKTRGFFFSWLKLYLSYSLYAPLGILIGAVTLEFGKFASNVSISMGQTEMLDLSSLVIVIVGMVLCIFLLLKIPNIINGILGTSNDGTTGGSGILGFMGGVAGGSASKLLSSGSQFFKDKVLSKGYDKLKSGLKGNKEGIQNTLDSGSIHE